jgi:import inner membrane translocase subunit TIM22
MQTHPLLAPVFPAGREPLPPGMTEEDRANVLQIKKYQDYMSAGMESCLGKTTLAGVFGTSCFSHFRTSPTVFFLISNPSSGFAAGGFFSMMSSSFAYEDPLLRQNLNTTQKSMEIFKDMGRGMWRSGKGFGKVGALYAGIECVIESVRTIFYQVFGLVVDKSDSSHHHSIEREMTW